MILLNGIARRGLIALAAMAWLTAAAAQPPAMANAVAIDDLRLQDMRGGFDDGKGLRASFGIERSVSINGSLVVSQSVQIADLSRITAEQAAQLHSMLSGVTLVANGPSNTFVPPVGAPGGATIIQNTLDGQTIKSLTVLNATSNSLGALQALNAAAALRNAVIAPVVARP